MPQTRPSRDEDREQRIRNEIVVDAHGPEEQVMGWFCYIEDQLAFPFPAVCDRDRPISPLKKGQDVVVTGMAPEVECMREMFVTVRWGDEQLLAVPLMQLIPSEAALEDNEESCEAVMDWRYWVDRGYEFG